MRQGLRVLMLGCSTLSAQAPGIAVSGPRTLALSVDDMAALPRTTVTTTVRGEDTSYEGVAVREVLTRAGVPAGDALRGDELAPAILVTGATASRSPSARAHSNS